MKLPRWFLFAMAALAVASGFVLGRTWSVATSLTRPARTCMAVFEVDGSKYEATVSGPIDSDAKTVDAEIQHADGQWRTVRSSSLKCAPAVREIVAR